MAPKYEIDGSAIETLDQFYNVLENALKLEEFGRNLDALDDVLGGGMGTPDEGFTLVWKNHAHSKEAMGYPHTVTILEERRKKSHPSNIAGIDEQIRDAEKCVGKTIFDELVEIFEEHREEGGVVLSLE